nr:hypothetical protein [Helicobacter pylori]
MVEKLKLGGLVLALCPYIMGILQGLSVQACLLSHALENPLKFCRGKISLFVRVKYSIIKF